jgi:hypothetical protein
MDIDFYRFRYLIGGVAAAVVLALVFVAFSIVNGPATGTPGSASAVTTTFAPSVVTTTTLERPALPESALTATDRKASQLVSDAASLQSGAGFKIQFSHVAGVGTVPHYTLLTSVGGYEKYPRVVRLGVAGTSQVLCLEINPPHYPPLLPAKVVACP